MITRTRFIIMLLLCVLLSSSTGCANEKNNGTGKNMTNITPKTVADNTGTPDTIPDKADSISKIMKSMTLEEKVGQIFIVSLRHMGNNTGIKIMDQQVKKRIQDNHVGGVILFSENINTISQTVKLIKDIKAASSMPLFIAVDEEGGLVSRLNKSSKMHTTKVPNSQIIGKTGDTELAKKVGTLIAKEIASLGFNMNFAPVADVNTNPENPVIGVRAFGKKPEIVAEMVKAEVEGMQSQNVISVLKHFPGHGDTATDSHTGEVVINHSRERLEKIEFVPFRKGIESGVDAIMTAHIKVPAVTGTDKPATMSKEILTGILREDMQFNGVIITDALDMGAISKYWNSGEAAVRAFEAGADILLMPLSIEEAYNGILSAVKEGRISEKRLDESVRRIIELKMKRGILENRPIQTDPEKILGSKEHLQVADEIRRKASKENSQK